MISISSTIQIRSVARRCLCFIYLAHAKSMVFAKNNGLGNREQMVFVNLRDGR
jgi:hypothetical protein